MKHLVLLGGGHAHVHVLQTLARAPLPGARVTLVSPFAELVYSGRVPAAVAGDCSAADCVIALAPQAERAGARFVLQAATALDAPARRVVLADGSMLDYDVLSVATGAQAARDTIPGAREHGLFVRPMELFLHWLPRLIAKVEAGAGDVVVIGGGAAGVELSIALQQRFASHARVSLVTGGTPPLPGYPASARRHAVGALKRAGVTVFELACTEIRAGQLLLGNGARLACDAPILALPAAPLDWFAGSGLRLDAAGFIATGPTLQSLSHPQVFAAGDAASRADLSRPRSGVYAVRAGPPLALNLRRCIAGGELLRHMPQRRSLNLLSCGEQRAIASWGPWAIEAHWCWRWKQRIDVGFVADARAGRLAGH